MIYSARAMQRGHLYVSIHSLSIHVKITHVVKKSKILYIKVVRKLCLGNLYQNIKIIKGQIPDNRSLGKDLITELNNLSLEAKNILFFRNYF